MFGRSDGNRRCSPTNRCLVGPDGAAVVEPFVGVCVQIHLFHAGEFHFICEDSNVDTKIPTLLAKLSQQGTSYAAEKQRRPKVPDDGTNRSPSYRVLDCGTLEAILAISLSKYDIYENKLRHFEVLNALGSGSGYWLLTMSVSFLFPHELVRFQRCGGFLSHHCSVTHARSILPNESMTRCPYLFLQASLVTDT